MAAFSHFCFFLIIIWVCFNLATNLGRQHASAFKMLLVQFLLIFWLLSTTHELPNRNFGCSSTQFGTVSVISVSVI